MISVCCSKTTTLLHSRTGCLFEKNREISNAVGVDIINTQIHQCKPCIRLIRSAPEPEFLAFGMRTGNNGFDLLPVGLRELARSIPFCVNSQVSADHTEVLRLVS